MKFDRYKAFPYPVLRPYSDDYIDIDFQTNVEPQVVENSITFDISYALSSPEIEKIVKDGQAEFISIVSCRDTYSRKIIITHEKSVIETFDAKDFRGEVRIDSYIVVKNTVEDFKSPDLNPEFGNGNINFSTGEVMAQDETQVFYIDRDLFKPVTSVFELVIKHDQPHGKWTIGYEEEHIQIELSQSMKESVDNARNSRNNKAILLNSIYFSAVVQAIQKLKDNAEDYKDKKWAKVILMQAHNKGYDLENQDAYLTGQELMMYPLSILNEYIFKGQEK
jgi:hypothetical protein